MSPVVYLSSYFAITRTDGSCSLLCFSVNSCRFRRPRGLRCGSVAARLLGLGVRHPPEAWSAVSCVCVVRCQVDISATGRSHVQRSPIECDREAYTRRWPSLTGAVEPRRKRKLLINQITILMSNAKNALAFSASSILKENLPVLTKLY